MAEPPPTFRYYDDPVADGTLRPSDATCAACNRQRGWMATSLLYSADKPQGARFCPWCIADGSVVARYGGTFNTLEPGASPEATAALEERTPNFETWQDWDWLVHCGDAMLYLGQPHAEQLRGHPDAVASLRVEGEADDELIEVMGPGAGAVAYLFRCLHCGAHRATWDAD